MHNNADRVHVHVRDLTCHKACVAPSGVLHYFWMIFSRKGTRLAGNAGTNSLKPEPGFGSIQDPISFLKKTEQFMFPNGSRV